MDANGVLSASYDADQRALRVTGDYAATDHTHDGTYAAVTPPLGPTGAVAETMPRNTHMQTTASLTSGRLQLYAVKLYAGQVVTNITFENRGAAVTPTNQWFALYSSARARLALTADDTTTAWGAFGSKTLALTSPYTVVTTGVYYLGICVVAATPPTLAGVDWFSPQAVAPILARYADTGLTDPASAPATAAVGGATNQGAYAYVT